MYKYNQWGFYSTNLQLYGALEDTLAELDRAETAPRKFAATRAVMAKYDMLPKLPYPGYCNYYTNVATRHRERGVERLMEREYYEAVHAFTESLLLCEPHSECWVSVLAYRSLALYLAKHYDECLVDSDRAVKCNKYPADTMHVLYETSGHAERELGRGDRAIRNYVECLKHVDRVAGMSDEHKKSYKRVIARLVKRCKNLSPGETAANEPETSATAADLELLGGKNERVPAISSCLELKCTANMGRGVFATCDINPGDVVAIDDPYMYEPDQKLNVCSLSSCLKSSFTVIPCTKCLLAIYCNEECMEKAYDEHRTICPIMLAIFYMPGHGDINKLAMKWFLRECSQMGLEQFCSTVDRLQSTAKTDPETRGFDENGFYKSDSFWTAYALDDGEDKLSKELKFLFNCIGVEMLEHLMLSGFDIPERYLPIVGAALVKMLRILDVNCLQAIGNSDGLIPFCHTRLLSRTVFVLCPSICLFNHSCDPNVMCYGMATGKGRYLKAVQPIPKGNQLFISYGTAYKSQTKRKRKELCSDFYISKCCCQPCLENWPIERFLPNRISLQNIINPDADKIGMLLTECDKYDRLKTSLSAENLHLHIDFLNYFMKLLFAHVKRPFALYEECFELICNHHFSLEYGVDRVLTKLFDHRLTST